MYYACAHSARKVGRPSANKLAQQVALPGPRQGPLIQRNLLTAQDAEMWVSDRAKPVSQDKNGGLEIFSGPIDLHIADMKEVGKKIGRSSVGLELLRSRVAATTPGRYRQSVT